MKTNARIFIGIVPLLCLTACKKVPEEAKRQSPSETEQSKSDESKNSIQRDGLDLLTDESIAKFSFDTLLNTLSKKISPEMLKKIETESESLPEIQGALGPGVRTFGMNVRSDAGLGLNVDSNNHLVGFGYTFCNLQPPPAPSVEKHLFEAFRLVNEELIEATDFELNFVPVQVCHYVHNKEETIKAVAFTHTSRILSFYDSSVVDVNKLLPGAPSSHPKEFLDELKKTKMELEKFKASQKK